MGVPPPSRSWAAHSSLPSWKVHGSIGRVAHGSCSSALASEALGREVTSRRDCCFLATFLRQGGRMEEPGCCCPHLCLPRCLCFPPRRPSRAAVSIALAGLGSPWAHAKMPLRACLCGPALGGETQQQSMLTVIKVYFFFL